MRPESSIRFIALVLMAVVLDTVSAQENQTASPQPPEPSPFTVNAGASVTGLYTDNVYSTENDRVGDFVTIVAPEVSLTAQAEDYQLDFGASAEFGFYADETGQDYNDARLSGEGQWNFSPETYLFGGLDYAWEHEDSTSPDYVGETKYREGSAFAGIAAGFGANALRAGINLRRLDYGDSDVQGGKVNNDDRDRLQSELGARFGHTLAGGGQLFLQGVYDRRNYDTATDDAGFKRDSDGVAAAIGYSGAFGPFQGEALVGILRQTYDDARFDTVTAPDFGAELSWQPDQASKIGLAIDRRLEETTVTGASGYLDTSAMLTAWRWFARDLRGNAYLGYAIDDYQDSSRRDRIGMAGFGLRYFLSPNLYVGAGYDYEQRSSTTPGEDYDSHSVFVQLGAELMPAYTRTDGMAAVGAGGFYAGLQAADGMLKTSLDGPRGGGGSLDAEFGDFGLSGGAFAGYRTEFGKVVVGAELDGGLGGADWSHVGNRVFSVELENSIGASAIVGLGGRNDVMLYGRAGLSAAEFETRYSQGGNSRSRSEREVGMRFGAGVEFPLSGSLSGRMEYGLISFPDYDFGPVAGAEGDNFASIANVASFGLVYNFGAVERAAATPVEFGGFYAGLQAGHGGLSTENSGPRDDPARPFVLDAERAGMGATGGIYAGYGKTFGQLYLGAEVEAELANPGWDIERDPNGRVYSVEKQGSVGAAMRAGYVVGDAVLIYGRAGVVNSWFETDYAFEDVSVSRDDSEVGLRLGGGVEFALTDRIRMRVDYTRTSYDSYKVDYGAGVDSFDNAENLFRIGLSYAF